MHIHNTVDYFIEHYEPTITFLEKYYATYPESFEQYFLYHCHQKEDKMQLALYKYAGVMDKIVCLHKKMETFIKQIGSVYEKKYDITFTTNAHIIVGAFGSNAFTHRDIIPDVTFCLEKLSSTDSHAKVIIAHELGHVLHGILSEQARVDWSQINWTHPYTMLFQEGCATYFSKQVVEVAEATYFTYDDEGAAWYHFARTNKRKIIRQFMIDIRERTEADIYREWFSINGGCHFGYTRLAYFIGEQVVQALVDKYTERKAVCLWQDGNFDDEIENILLNEKDSI